MRSSIFGFNQDKLIEFNLDATDALILRYFIDFKESGLMMKKNINGEDYYWLRYDGVITDLPILNLKKDAIYRRLKNMVKINILNHKTIKYKGVFSYYSLGPKYRVLTVKSSKNHGDLNPERCGNKSRRVTEINTEPYESKTTTLQDLKPEQTINLLKDEYTKYNNIYGRIINYLNKKANKTYKATIRETQEFIQARLDEGFNLKDFYRVIDIKALEWKNTDMDKYLRPSTLFGVKFERYLNQKSKEERVEAYMRDECMGFSV